MRTSLLIILRRVRSGILNAVEIKKKGLKSFSSGQSNPADRCAPVDLNVDSDEYLYLEPMNTQIILLRGLTPTGKNKVLMAPLRVALEETGLKNVRTYIQSGNIIASTDLDQTAVEKLVHAVIKDNFGGDIAVLSRTASYFRKALARNPFNGADTSKLYFTLLAAKPEIRILKEFLAPGYAPDKIEVVGDMAYVLCATKYSDLKVNNNFIERKLRVAATTRNYNTISKIAEMGME